jgi:hypothetical protein
LDNWGWGPDTLKAVAVLPGYQISQPATATYTINLPPAPTLTFSLPEGTYSSFENVSISDAANDAIIYYTIDGSTPTTRGGEYGGPFTLMQSQTVKAIAVAKLYSTSAIASATYTITTPNFSVSATPTALNVNAGGSASTTITVTPLYGFNSAVSFACTGLPSGATCNFSPQTVTPSGANAQTTLTVTTPLSSAELHRSGGPEILATALAGFLCFLGRKKQILLKSLVLIIWAGVVFSSGCGGASSAPPPPTPVSQGYTVVVNASSGVSLLQSTTIVLTVTQSK